MKPSDYYFGVSEGRKMRRMKRRELYGRLSDAYQLAGSLLIGARLIDADEGPQRNVNGWTDKEVERAVVTLLDFLSCPANVSAARFDRALAIYRPRKKGKDE